MDTVLQKFLEGQEADLVRREQQALLAQALLEETERARIKGEFDKVLPFIPEPLHPYCMVGTWAYPVMLCIPEHHTFYACPDEYLRVKSVVYQLTGDSFSDLPTVLRLARNKQKVEAQDRLEQELAAAKQQQAEMPPIAPPSQSLERIAIALEVLAAHLVEASS